MAFKFKKESDPLTVTILDGAGKEEIKYSLEDAEKEKVKDEEVITDEEVEDNEEMEDEEEYVYDADEVKEVMDMCKDMGYEKLKDMATACKSYKDAESDSDVLDEDDDKDKKEKDKEVKDSKQVLDKLKSGEKKLRDEAKAKLKAKLSDEEKQAAETAKIVQEQYDSFRKPKK